MNVRAPVRDDLARGGSDRPPRLAPRAVVVAPDAVIRDDWTRALEASGMVVARCVGPAVSCILLEGGDRCPLLDEAGIALYQESILTDEFVATLRAAHHSAMVIAARDRCRVNGDHEPAMSRVVSSPTA